MESIQQVKYMRRCLDLARMGFGSTSPNPMVGSVIVFNDKIIGEGYHRRAGEPHAEVNAINSVKNRNLLNQSTLYVNLEPCSHFGKTPPCANLIADLKIPNVVIGTIDTAAHVSGKGIEILKKAGCNVRVGVLEKESRELNKRFFTFYEKKRPYIILKWAETLDGFVDIEPDTKKETRPTWISNQYSKVLVHKWRSEEDAILIGTNTVISDNPSLTTREWAGKSPLRIAIDKNFRLSQDLNIFNNHAKTLVIADKKNSITQNETLSEKIGIEFVDFPLDFANHLSTFFVKNKIQSVIIEGGAKTLQYFIDANYWDEARVFIGPKVFKKGVNAPILNKKNAVVELLGSSKLLLVSNIDNYYQ
ncbi:MAG: riboflavin biosynthesis protein RibD [Bacteroidetes bacterium GWF2_33_16]|nr:MAG: riboflavin biosynthesis protein RibD [Bacteroidetes bacterium GWE2_32_14]OFY03648.1 MAG: riboflavin biosynthesis protein RibD [Bacteroidetes bacterium GWF2_33_16]